MNYIFSDNLYFLISMNVNVTGYFQIKANVNPRDSLFSGKRICKSDILFTDDVNVRDSLFQT
jgi:hypothetical protein